MRNRARIYISEDAMRSGMQPRLQGIRVRSSRSHPSGLRASAFDHAGQSREQPESLFMFSFLTESRTLDQYPVTG